MEVKVRVSPDPEARAGLGIVVTKGEDEDEDEDEDDEEEEEGEGEGQEGGIASEDGPAPWIARGSATPCSTGACVCALLDQASLTAGH